MFNTHSFVSLTEKTIILTQHLLIRKMASLTIFGIGGNMNNVVNLRGTQRTSNLDINHQKININDIVLVYDEMVPRDFWRIAIVTGVLPT